jgi:virginiamycin B lyase
MVAVGFALVAISGPGEVSPATALAGGTAWFYAPSTSEAVQIDGATGKTSGRVSLDQRDPSVPLDVVQAGSAAVLVDADHGTAQRIDPATRRAGPAVPLEPSGDPRLAVVANGDVGWALLQQGTAVEQLDLRQLAAVSAPASMADTVAGAAVDSDGTLWVTSADGHVRSFRNGAQVADTELPDAQHAGLVLVGDRPTVFEPDRHAAFVLDRRGRPGDTRCLDVGADQDPVVSGATDHPWLLTVAARTGTLLVTDVDRNACQSVVLGGTADVYGAAVEDDGLIYVPDRHLGQVVVVDPVRPPGQQVRARIDIGLPDADVRLFAHGQHVWFDERGGDAAGVITSDLRVVKVSKSAAPPADPNAPTGPGAPAPTPNGSANAGSTGGPPTADPTSAVGAAAPGGAPGSPTITITASPTGDTIPAPPPTPAPATTAATTVPGGGSTSTTTTPPGATAAWSATANPTTETAVQFTDVSTGPHTVVGWTFEGGDIAQWPPANNPGSDAAHPPSVTFSTPGDHPVVLTIRRADGSSDFDSRSIRIATPTPLHPTFVDFPVTGTNRQPKDVVVGPDGNLWVGVFDDANVLIIDPSTGAMTSHTDEGGNGANDVTVGPDGDIWYIGGNGLGMAKVDPRTRTGTTFALPFSSGFTTASTIAGGPNQTIWVSYNGTIAEADTNGHGIAQFPSPSGQPLRDLVEGPDGRMWFTDPTANVVGAITTNGTMSTFPLQANAQPRDITVGPDGALWFVENSGAIGRITTTGQLREFAIPTTDSQPFALTTGPDGAIWFTESFTGKIGRVSMAGVVTDYPLLPSNAEAWGIVTGPDHNLWVMENAINRYARVSI